MIDGSPQDISGNSHAATGVGENNAALYVDNGSTIEGDTVIITAPNNNEYVGNISGAGTIDLKSSNLTGNRGISANGNNATLNLNTVDMTITRGDAIGFTDTAATSNKLTILGGVINHSSNSTGDAAIKFTTGGDLLLDNATIKANNSARAVNIAGGNSPTSLTARNGWQIEKSGNGVQALFIGANVDVDLKDGKIITTGTAASAIRSMSALTMTDVDIETSGNNADGIFVNGGDNATPVKMTNGKISLSGNNGTAVHLTRAAQGEFDNVAITSLNNINLGVGIDVIANSTATLKNKSSIYMEGASGYALHFDTEGNNTITVDDSQVTSKDHYAAIATGTSGNILNLANGSVIEGDRLLGALQTSSLTVNADNAQLFGHALKAATATTIMNLDNGSVWTIRPNAAGTVLTSTINQLALDNASVVFDQNGSNHYQKLLIDGATLPYAYQGGNGAAITFNSLLNEGGAASNQFTDRLLIHGNVTGKTLVHINEVTGSPGGLTSPSGAYLNSEGISIIQVSGTAAEDSFALPGGYVTMGGLPYMYDLCAYGPGSSLGSADAAQTDASLANVGGSNNWDFRLQSKTTAAKSCGMDDGSIWQVAPQMANYLTAPRALFHAGLQDIGNLQQHLGDMRIRTSTDSASQRGEFFLYGYGGDYHYRSNLSAAQYGFDADVNYVATQAGGNLYGFESDNSVMRFGLSGSWGTLSLAPDRLGSEKTKLEIWSIAPYATWQHHSGGYIDIVLSYGGFDGLVTTSARGRTTRLQGNIFASSIEAGMPFALNSNGLTIEPQAQLIYQKLKFDESRDIDNFAVALGNPQQWTMLADAELAKQFSLQSSGSNVRLYGKLTLIHSFDDNNKAWFGNDFGIGKAGTHLESGIGGKITIGSKINLYGEASWQERLSHGGTNGLSLNGGVNLKF